LENLKGRDQSEDRGVDGGESIRMYLREVEWKLWTGCIWLRTYGPVEGYCEHGNELSGYIKDGEFVD